MSRLEHPQHDHKFLIDNAEILERIFKVWLEREREKVFKGDREERDFQIEFCNFLEDKVQRFKTNMMMKEHAKKTDRKAADPQV